MKRVKIAELKDHLSRHLRAVERGMSLEVTDRDRPIARIVPLAKEPAPVRLIPPRRSFALLRRKRYGRAAWAVGDEGGAYRWLAETGWVSELFPDRIARLIGVGALDTEQAWAVADSGKLFRRDASGWALADGVTASRPKAACISKSTTTATCPTCFPTASASRRGRSRRSSNANRTRSRHASRRTRPPPRSGT